MPDPGEAGHCLRLRPRADLQAHPGCPQQCQANNSILSHLTYENSELTGIELTKQGYLET